MHMLQLLGIGQVVLFAFAGRNILMVAMALFSDSANRMCNEYLSKKKPTSNVRPGKKKQRVNQVLLYYNNICFVLRRQRIIPTSVLAYVGRYLLSTKRK